MITYENYTMRKDANGWVLTQHYITRGPTGEAKDRYRNLYYANLKQCCMKIIDDLAGKCSDINDIIYTIKKASTDLQEVVLRD